MKKSIILMILFLTFVSAFGQFGRQKIMTDSSEIEIVRNSYYHIYEETYKQKDSVWYSVHFIQDTTKLNTEGWKTKNDKYLGVWQEFNFDGQLMYTMDYDNSTCVVNKEIYRFHDLLEEMKSKADSLIISTYSKEFFDNHVKFNFNCYAYKGIWRTYEDGNKIWLSTYVGSWLEPIKSKPDKYVFLYDVKYGESDWYPDMIEINLNSDGGYLPCPDDRWNTCGFEKVKANNNTFNLDKTNAREIAKDHGLVISDTTEISDFLTWENLQNRKFYNGHFRYYVTELTSKSDYSVDDERQGIIFRYNVYIFNPWTGEFIEKKKMKSRKEWGKYSGHTTGLLPDN